MTAVPNLTLSNGKTMPILGLGTWNSKPGEVEKAVLDAIDAGYRHIDCALAYQNENEVGDAIKKAIADGKVTREDLFITSKLWNTFHRTEKVVECCQKTLASLGLEYVDLYLIHWPFGYKEGDDLFPRNENGIMITNEIDYMDTWKAMEECLSKGLTKSIGLSNFNKDQIERVLKEGTVKPVSLQVECHPYLNQNELIAYCKSKDIIVTAYSPLGSPNNPVMANSNSPILIEEPIIKSIADQHGKSIAQVLIRFQIERGVCVIPKSITKSRILANIDVFDFKLTADNLLSLNNIGVKHRYVALEWNKEHPFFPFAAPF